MRLTSSINRSCCSTFVLHGRTLNLRSTRPLGAKMQTTHLSEIGLGPRRAMRKGTRSCYECRKRKVRCIFGKNSSICEGCALRGKRCVEQSRELLQESALESKESLKERITRLEAIVHASTNESKHMSRAFVADCMYSLTLSRAHTDTKCLRARVCR